MRSELPSGAWVEHRPIGDLKLKDRDAVDAAARMIIPLDDEGKPALGAGLELSSAMDAARRDALWARVITAWSLPVPVPECDRYGNITGRDSLGDLDLDTAADLDDLFKPYEKKLRRRPDPKAVTTSPSNGSSPANAAQSSPTG